MNNPYYTFASTLPKPHEPTLQPKFCQRACKANAPREIVLKNLPTLKKIKNADTRADTDRQESNMTMTRKHNTDNGLQGQSKEHQAVTTSKTNCLKTYPLTKMLTVGQYGSACRRYQQPVQIEKR